MLTIIIPATELWDEKKQEFIYIKEQTLRMEHSLVSISKWESKWSKPFFSKEGMTYDETIDYIRCMTITQNVKPETYLGLTDANVKQIEEYMKAPMTATTFFDNKVRGSGHRGEQVTAELIYYWMFALNIPLDCAKWHINKLITLIRVCEIKNQPPKKMSKREIASRNHALNAARRKQLNTKG